MYETVDVEIFVRREAKAEDGSSGDDEIMDEPEHDEGEDCDGSACATKERIAMVLQSSLLLLLFEFGLTYLFLSVFFFLGWG